MTKPQKIEGGKKLAKYLVDKININYQHSLITIDQFTYNEIRKLAGFKTGIVEDCYGHFTEILL